jgi:hypothetical protein
MFYSSPNPYNHNPEAPITHAFFLYYPPLTSHNTAFLKVFPRATKEQDENFKLLKKAYIDTRYKKDYKITKKQLEYLAKRVKILQRLTKKICTAKIESFV